MREITGALLLGFSSDHLLGLIAERARQLVNADLAVVCVPRSSDTYEPLELRAAAGTNARMIANTAVPPPGRCRGR